jgi:hypothetical protein
MIQENLWPEDSQNEESAEMGGDNRRQPANQNNKGAIEIAPASYFYYDHSNDL